MWNQDKKKNGEKENLILPPKKDRKGRRPENVKGTLAFDRRQLWKGRRWGHLRRLLQASVATNHHQLIGHQGLEGVFFYNCENNLYLCGLLAADQRVGTATMRVGGNEPSLKKTKKKRAMDREGSARMSKFCLRKP